MRVKYNVDTQLIFQIGDPLEHSSAGMVHNAVFEYANLNAICTLVKVNKENLADFIKAVKVIGASGFDITTPVKGAVIEYLDECDPLSRAFGCVNHVKCEDRKLIGIGLDGVGMGMAIHEEYGSVEGKTILILGAGAVAGPIAADLAKRGAAKFFIANRTVEKAQNIAAILKHFYPEIEVQACQLDFSLLEEIAPEVDVCVQCTSAGYGENAKGLDSLAFVARFREDCFCADVTCGVTKFVACCRQRGLRAIDGVGMLVSQQFAGAEFHFGIKLPLDARWECEEAAQIAIALRSVREKRLAEEKKERR